SRAKPRNPGTRTTTSGVSILSYGALVALTAMTVVAIPVVLEPAAVPAVIVLPARMDLVVQGIVVVMLDQHRLIMDHHLVNYHRVRPDSPLPVRRRVHHERRRAHDQPSWNRTLHRAARGQAKKRPREQMISHLSSSAPLRRVAVATTLLGALPP